MGNWWEHRIGVGKSDQNKIRQCMGISSGVWEFQILVLPNKIRQCIFFFFWWETNAHTQLSYKVLNKTIMSYYFKKNKEKKKKTANQ